ncbi:MAG: hypothetical protein H0W61_09900 [Bacteroidetes bacterium]|nr:hypothetical protein [Bacteroidota bacterium]
MENKNQLDDFLKEKMSHLNSGIQGAPVSFLMEARKKVISRQKENEKQDVFFSVARFLDLKIRLPYAAVFILAIGAASMYIRKENTMSSASESSPYLVNIESARSTTVLSSIITFETRH